MADEYKEIDLYDFQLKANKLELETGQKFKSRAKFKGKLSASIGFSPIDEDNVSVVFDMIKRYPPMKRGQEVIIYYTACNDYKANLDEVEIIGAAPSQTPAAPQSTTAPTPPPPATALQAATPAPRPATEKVGNIRKCPACGAEVESFQSRCSNCGHEFNEAIVSGSIQEFFDKIMRLDSRPRPQQREKDKASHVFLKILAILGFTAVVFVVASMTFENMAWVWSEELTFVITIAAGILFGKLLFRVKIITEDDTEKKSLVENFPIPNTRQDILEFLMLASSKIVPANGFDRKAALQREWNKVWATKCRQVFLKADVAFAGDKTSLSQVNTIREKYESVMKAAQKRALILYGAAAAVVAVCIAITAISATGGFSTAEEREDKILANMKRYEDYGKIEPRYKSDRLNRLVVAQYGSALKYVPDDMKTEEVCRIAIENSGSALNYVPAALKTPALYEIAVAGNGQALQYVPEKDRTQAICEAAVKQSGWALQYVPEKFKTSELCNAAVTKSGSALQYVPEGLKTQSMCNAAVTKSGSALQYVPEGLKTQSMCNAAVTQSGSALQYVPEGLKTQSMCDVAVKKFGVVLQYVPEKFKTLAVCTAAVKNYRYAIDYVPADLQEQVKAATK